MFYNVSWNEHTRAVSLKCELAGYSCLSPPRSDGTNQWTVLRPTNTCTILRLVCHTKSVKRQRWICVCVWHRFLPVITSSFIRDKHLSDQYVSVMKLRNFQRTHCVSILGHYLSTMRALLSHEWIRKGDFPLKRFKMQLSVKILSQIVSSWNHL